MRNYSFFLIVATSSILTACDPSLIGSTSLLSLSAPKAGVMVTKTIQLQGSGGVPPYEYQLVSGGGFVDSSTGEYQASNTSGTAVIRVIDSEAKTARLDLPVYPQIAVVPSSLVISITRSHDFDATGGLGPYAFDIISGEGQINRSTGEFTASVNTGNVVIRVKDSLGNIADANVTVEPLLTISPSSLTMVTNTTHTFSGSGGTPSYTFSVASGTGSINASTGVYTAPATPDPAVTIQITDANGNTDQASVIVNPPVAISPTAISLAVTNQTTFSASGGVSPYAFSIASGAGNVGASTGEFTAPSSAGTVVVRVTDAVGGVSDATVTVNPALTITPSEKTLAVNNVYSFTAAGGVTPYTYAVISGSGTVDANGNYTAPASSGSAVLRVTDSFGNTADAFITINPALAASPTSKDLAVGNSYTQSQTGGVSPYTYAVISGTGSIDATGYYTAPASSGTDIVRITDSMGNTADVTVSIAAALAISPASASVGVGNTYDFDASGGVTPYSFWLIAGSGTVDLSTGLYKAPGSPGTATIRVTDSLGNTSDASVTINSVLSISPSTVTLAVGNTQTFTASDGVSPYTFSIASGGGTIGSGTGVFTAGASAGTTVVRVTDSASNTADATVTVNEALAISPASKTVAVNNTVSFSASGGVSPYTYSVVTGAGTIGSSTGNYTAPATTGTETIRVTDSYGNTSDATITVNGALAISPATKTLAASNSFTFTASGGVTPYSYSVAAGSGTIGISTGEYIAPSVEGTATVRVTDAVGNISDSAVTIEGVLAISPASKTVAVDNANSGTSNQITFTGVEGVPAYSYSVVSGTGTVNASTGVYTPGTAGTDIVRVTDSMSPTPNTADAVVTVNPAISVTPTSKTLAVNNIFTFAADGGVPPYAFSVPVGGGTIDAGTGEYTAPATTGTATVRVTDSLGNYTDASVTINAALAISPASKTVAVGNTFTYSSSGGVSPYAYAILSGGGSVNPSTGAFTAPSTSGTTQVRVTDAVGNISDSVVTIKPPLAITPGAKTVAVGNSIIFSASDGVSSYTYSIVSGGGSLSVTGPTTGSTTYTAPATAGTAVVRVTDSATPTANTIDATVTINDALQISPATLSIVARNSYSFSATGGVGGHTYSIFSGSGTVSSSTGNYVAPSAAGTDVVRVTDDIGNTSDSSVTVTIPTKIVSGAYHSCALFGDGSVRCWGYNEFGQLGLEDMTNRTVGEFTPINLGTGLTATDIAAGGYHTCAVLNTGDVKCWGYNAYGQLGYDDMAHRGDAASEMGDSLAAIALGNTATSVSAGLYHSCALLSDQTVKCWGYNAYGQLGQGDTANRGDATGEMSLLASIALGTTVSQIESGQHHNCAILTDSTLKCWGYNSFGQLGLEDRNHRGDAASEMGVSLPTVSLGSAPSQVSIGGPFTCALLSDATVKCWGSNNYGQLGQGDTVERGATVGDMGSLSAISLGTGRTATAIAAGDLHACARLDDGSLKCWGYNHVGQLGQEDTVTRGDGASEMGDSLFAIDLGVSRTVYNSAAAINAGFDHVCAILDHRGMKCWGHNGYGQLGQGDTVNRGDLANTMGGNLPIIGFAP